MVSTPARRVRISVQVPRSRWQSLKKRLGWRWLGPVRTRVVPIFTGTLEPWPEDFR